MTTGGRSPHMPGGVDRDDLAEDGAAKQADVPREGIEPDPLMGETEKTDSTGTSPGVEPPD